MDILKLFQNAEVRYITIPHGGTLSDTVQPPTKTFFLILYGVINHVTGVISEFVIYDEDKVLFRSVILDTEPSYGYPFLSCYSSLYNAQMPPLFLMTDRMKMVFSGSVGSSLNLVVLECMEKK